ncbi:mutator protein [Hordeum vulgare]|nr:mutator protein [Hordeum vulgare]
MLLFLTHSPPKPDPFSPTSNAQRTEPSILSENPKHQVKMQYNWLTFLRPPVVPELRYPLDVLVESELRVWVSSRWRGFVELARVFLRAGYAHLPRGSPRMFTLNGVCDRAHTLVLLTVTFANQFDTCELLGQVYWCGCESIFFTVYNIFTNYKCIFHKTRCTPFPTMTRRSEVEDGGEGARPRWKKGQDEDVQEGNLMPLKIRSHGASTVMSYDERTIFADDCGKNTQWMWLKASTVFNNKFSWGSTALAYLYRQLDEACRRSTRDGIIGGCMLLLSVWSWERLPVGHTGEVTFKAWDDHDNHVRLPNWAYKWDVVSEMTSDVNILYKQYTNEMDSLTAEQRKEIKKQADETGAILDTTHKGKKENMHFDFSSRNMARSCVAYPTF